MEHGNYSKLQVADMGVFVVVAAKEWELVKFGCMLGASRCDYPCKIRLQLTFFFDTFERPLFYGCFVRPGDVQRSSMAF